MSDSITRMGVIFIFYLFISLLIYFVLSTPVAMLFDGFDDADFGEAENEKNRFLPNIRTSFTIAMAFFIGIPVTWFIMKIFSREPDYSRFRRY